MLPLEHSAILLTCIKQLLVLKTNFGLLFEWPLKTGFTVLINGIPQVDWMQLGRSVVHRNIQHDTGLYEPFFCSIKHVGLDARKPVFGVCDQQRRRPAWASAQTDQRLC